MRATRPLNVSLHWRTATTGMCLTSLDEVLANLVEVVHEGFGDGAG